MLCSRSPKLLSSGTAGLIGAALLVGSVGVAASASAAPAGPQGKAAAVAAPQSAFVPVEFTGSDTVTAGSPATVTGRATPHTRIVMVTSSEPTTPYEARADADGVFSVTAERPWQGESTSVTVYQDAGGQDQAGKSAKRTYTVQQAAFVPVEFTGSDTVTAGSPATVTGRATPHTRIVMVTSSEPTTPYEARADADGVFSVTAERPWQGESTSVTVYQDAGGQDQAGKSAKRTYTVQQAAFVPVEFTGSDTVTAGSPLVVTGTATPHAEIHVVSDLNELRVKRTLADGNGVFSLTTDVPARVGRHVVQAQQVTGRPEQDARVIERTYVARSDAPTPVVVTSAATYTKHQVLRIEGTGKTGEEIDVRITGTTMRDAVVPGEGGRWVLDLPVQYTGWDKVTLVFTAEGEEYVHAFTGVSGAFTITSDRTYAKGQGFRIEGTAKARADIDVSIAGTSMRETISADEDGRWTLDLPVQYAGWDKVTLVFGTGDAQQVHAFHTRR